MWINRHEGEAQRKKCRAAFLGAVAAVAQDVEREQPGSGAWLLEAYNAAIDFGGHPNIKSVFTHIRFQEAAEADPHCRVSLGGLYGADHWKTRSVLIACAEFSLAIAVVLTRALKEPDEQHQQELQRLNNRKNAVVAA